MNTFTRFKRMVATVSLTAIIASIALVAPVSADVRGVPSSHWAYASVAALVDAGVIDAEGDARLTESVNRAELAKMISLAAELDVPETVDTPPFPDVPANAWFAKYVQAVVDAGVMGVNVATFRPIDGTNKAELAATLSRAFDWDEEEECSEAPFGDVAVDAWYCTAVAAGKDAGVFTGEAGSNLFKPGSTVNRAVAFKSVAFAGDFVTEEVAAETPAAETPATPETPAAEAPIVPPSTGTLAVSADSSVAPITIAGGTAFNIATAIKMEATGEEVLVTGLKLQREGFLANTTIRGVSIFDNNGVRHGNVLTSLSDIGEVTVLFPANPIRVAVGSPVVATVRVNLATVTNSGTLKMVVEEVMANAVSVSGAPVAGPLHTVVAGAGVAAFTVAWQTVGGGASTSEVTLDIGISREVAKYRITETSANEDMWLQSLTVYNNGNAADGDFTHFVLKSPEGTDLVTVESTTNKYVEFILPGDGYQLKKGTARDFSIWATVTSGATRTLSLTVQNDYEVVAKGVQTGSQILSGSTFPVTSTTDSYFQVSSGTLTCVRAAASRSGNVALGEQSVEVGRFTCRSSGEAMEIRRIGLEVVTTNSADAALADADADLTGTLRVLNPETGAVYWSGATSTASLVVTGSATASGSVAYLGGGDLNTYLNLPENTDVPLAVMFDIAQGATSGNKMYANLGRMYGKRLATNDFSTTNVGSQANALSLISSSLTLTSNSAYGSSTVAPSSLNARLGSWALRAGSAENMLINTLSTQFSAAETTYVKNVKFMTGGCSGTQLGTVLANPSTTNSTSVSLTVSKSQTVIIDVCGDVQGTSVTAGNASSVELRATGVGSGSGTSVSAPTSSTYTAGQTITFGAGVLLVTRDSSTPESQILTPSGTTKVELARFKYEARNEPIKLNRLTFNLGAAQASTDEAAMAANFGTVYLMDGTEQIGTGTLDVLTGSYARVTFSGLNVVVSPTPTKTLSIQAEVTGGTALTRASVVRVQQLATADSDTTLFEARGDSTGTLLADGSIYMGGTITDANVSGDYMLFHLTKPVAAKGTGESAGLSTTQKVFVFSVTNVGEREMTFRRVDIAVSATGLGTGGSLGTWNFYRGDLAQLLAQDATVDSTLTSEAGHGSATLSFSAANDVPGLLDSFTISAGATQVFTLTANTTAVLTGVSSGGTVTLSSRLASNKGALASDTTAEPEWANGVIYYRYSDITGDVVEGADTGVYDYRGNGHSEISSTLIYQR